MTTLTQTAKSMELSDKVESTELAMQHALALNMLDQIESDMRRNISELVSEDSAELHRQISDLTPYLGRVVVFHYYDQDETERLSGGPVINSAIGPRVDFEAQPSKQLKTLNKYMVYPRFIHATHLNVIVSKDNYAPLK